MLVSSESHNDDGDMRMLQVAVGLEPGLKTAWDANSVVYNASLTSSLRGPETGVVDTQRAARMGGMVTGISHAVSHLKHIACQYLDVNDR